MKSYKQRTLDAQLDLIRRYEENDPPEHCSFCEIYPAALIAQCHDGWGWIMEPGLCRGCFMKDRADSNSGCTRFDSYISSTYMRHADKDQRLARAAFHRKVRKILLKRPAKYFTPKGWKYLDIPKEW
ncbi:MAG: hypothetical protein KKC03_14010 [Bacteroidetes bacterium]|nr:hypothetical protein [Bacteroidota bacterium]